MDKLQDRGQYLLKKNTKVKPDTYSTEQESFWAGEFGKDYIARNTLTPLHRAATTAQWTKILHLMDSHPKSILEFGANIGNNLAVLHDILPEAKLNAVEINPTAAEHLRQWGGQRFMKHQSSPFLPSVNTTLFLPAPY